jgi:Uma2 family endonuclease
MSDTPETNTERKLTYADYKAWELKPDEQYEMIGGEVFAMSVPNASHQTMLMELSRQFANFLVGKTAKVYPAPYDVRLFYEEDESDDTVVQPDITVVCDPEKRGPEGCRGAPDFIAEILSPLNTATEMQHKFNLYRIAGVREYWALDNEYKTLTVYLFDGENVISRIYGKKDKAPVSVLNGLSIDLVPVFGE